MEDQTRPGDDNPRQALKPSGGKDELNLAEFPITLLSDRVPKGCKTLVFEIEPRENRTGPPRKVTITGSDAYGLPTAIDDEILVALIQLTKLKNGFTSPTVQFSRYEVLKLLGWPDDGKGYRRIEESIKRWAGVTLYYDNAWWDKETGSLVSETFHIIERSSILSQESRRSRKASHQYELPLSVFKWNEVIFRSFEAGALKRLDIEAYFSLSSSVAKRVYRFLDKRFWVKDCWQFDLKEFAFEHIGLSRKYNVAQIKNKLRPAIDELSQSTTERAVFLEPMDADERFVKIGKGRWLVTFARKTETLHLVDLPAPEPQGLAQELIARGVSQEVAAELVATRPTELITLRIEVFDWLLLQKNQKVIRESPVGYLISSIRDRYLTVPKGFESNADRQKRQEAEAAKRRAEQEEARKRHAEKVREDEFHHQAKALWDSLTEGERKQLEAQALADTDEERRRHYDETLDVRHKRLLMVPIREAYIRKLIDSADAPGGAVLKVGH